MKKTTILALVLALVLVVGAVFVSANVISNNAEEKPAVIENQPDCGCGCNGQCGGNCGVASCGCGK